MNSNVWKTIALILIGVLLGYMFGKFDFASFNVSDYESKKIKVEQEDKNNGKEEPKIELVEATEDDDPFLGAEVAQVVVIDFSDYECPFCKKFYTNIFPEFKKEFLDTKKVKYVYRDFPLNIHPKAKIAAQAAECARDQYKYWEMHGLLYDKQSEWSDSEDLKETLISYAVELRLNKAIFSSCLNDGKYLEEVEKDRNDALAAGAKGTPTLFVNGEIIRGLPQNYESFKALIESELQ
jgi:protein-disulfide isomerase